MCSLASSAFEAIAVSVPLFYKGRFQWKYLLHLLPPIGSLFIILGILGLHMASPKDPKLRILQIWYTEQYVQDCYALRFHAKFWDDTKHLRGAVVVWTPWQTSRLSRALNNVVAELEPVFLGKVLQLTCTECESETEWRIRYSSPFEILPAMLVDSSIIHLPLSNLKKEIATTSPKWTLDIQKSVSGLIRMCSFQFWDLQSAILKSVAFQCNPRIFPLPAGCMCSDHTKRS